MWLNSGHNAMLNGYLWSIRHWKIVRYSNIFEWPFTTYNSSHDCLYSKVLLLIKTLILWFTFNFRSDCVFTIHVEQKSNGVSTVKGIRSKITLIDMAGIRNNNLTWGQELTCNLKYYCWKYKILVRPSYNPHLQAFLGRGAILSNG